MHKWGECSRGLNGRLQQASLPTLRRPAWLPAYYCRVPAHPAQTPQPPSAHPALPPTLPPGHMRLRAILNREPPFPSAFKGAPVIAQFSSLGSIEDKWCASPRPSCGYLSVGRCGPHHIGLHGCLFSAASCRLPRVPCSENGANASCTSWPLPDDSPSCTLQAEGGVPCKPVGGPLRRRQR